MFERCHFIIPDPEAFPSGGNVYNACLMDRLRESGLAVSWHPFQPGTLPEEKSTRYVLDSIYFTGIDRPSEQIPGNCIALIHHLDSLFPFSDAHFESHERSVLDRFAGYLTTSPFTRDYLVGRGYDPERITVIDPAPLLPRADRTPSPKVRALILGSCTPRKGQLEFLVQLAYSGTPPFYTLTIAGSLEADPEYALRCKTLILEHPALKACVRLIGSQQAGSIPGLYAKANLFISSAVMETYGMAIQDAVAAGIPVLVREGGYAGEHVREGTNGYRFSDAAQMAKVFRRCVEDADFFLALQARAADYAHPYQTWEMAAETFIRAFMQ